MDAQGRPRISRELLARINSQTPQSRTTGGAYGVTGRQASVANRKTNARRRFIKRYADSSVANNRSIYNGTLPTGDCSDDQVTAADNYGQNRQLNSIRNDSPTDQEPSRREFGANRPNTPSFNEPPARSYNPYG